MLVFVLLFCLSCGAFTISAVAGGGAGLVIMPVLGLLLTASKIPAALSLGTMCSTIGRIATFRHAIDWRVVSCFLPAALPAAALGVFCLRLMPPVYLEMFLGLFLSGNVVLLLRPASPVMTDQAPGSICPPLAWRPGSSRVSLAPRDCCSIASTRNWACRKKPSLPRAQRTKSCSMP